MLQQKSYQAKQYGPHFFETQGANAPKWFVVDAKDQVVGRIATIIARVVTGKHKPTYTKHADTGDFLVVLNADKVVFTRNKWEDKLYRDHTGYVSGLKTKTAKEMLQRHPEEILRRAVWGMTNKSSLARHQMKKLKIFAGSEHPHQAQGPVALPAGAIRNTVLSRPKKQVS
ncbi:MAG: 50S ribosomal protein L13 [Bdellovibrionia bacterium]